MRRNKHKTLGYIFLVDERAKDLHMAHNHYAFFFGRKGKSRVMRTIKCR